MVQHSKNSQRESFMSFPLVCTNGSKSSKSIIALLWNSVVPPWGRTFPPPIVILTLPLQGLHFLVVDIRVCPPNLQCPLLPTKVCMLPIASHTWGILAFLFLEESLHWVSFCWRSGVSWSLEVYGPFSHQFSGATFKKLSKGSSQ